MEIFSISDPIIVIWTTEDKPGTSSDSSFNKGDSLENDVQLYSIEHLDSLFFPNGFLRNEWNLVVVSVKDEQVEKYPYMKQLLRGWMMGTNINQQVNFDGNFSIKMP